MMTDCFTLMGSMGWIGWLMSLSVLLLVGLSIASLAKYLFSRQSSHKASHKENRS